MTSRTEQKIIERFNVGVERISLAHHREDDSRSVINDDGAVLLRFDSSCGVWQGNKKIGTLNDRKGMWTFIPFIETARVSVRESFATSQPIRDYHWFNLQKAEVEVAQHILMWDNISIN